MDSSKTKTKRTRLAAVYLTSIERDLLITGMQVLRDALGPQQAVGTFDKVNNFSRSFTARRIDDVVEILRGPDKKTSAAVPA